MSTISQVSAKGKLVRVTLDISHALQPKGAVVVQPGQTVPPPFALDHLSCVLELGNNAYFCGSRFISDSCFEHQYGSYQRHGPDKVAFGQYSRADQGRNLDWYCHAVGHCAWTISVSFKVEPGSVIAQNRDFETGPTRTIVGDNLKVFGLGNKQSVCRVLQRMSHVKLAHQLITNTLKRGEDWFLVCL